MATNILEVQSALCKSFTDGIHDPEAYVPFAKPGSRAAEICASYAVMFSIDLNSPTEYTVGILSPSATSEQLLFFPFSHRPLTKDERDIGTPLLHNTVIQDARQRCRHINRTLYYPFVAVPTTNGVLSWLIAGPAPESPEETALLSLSEQLPDTTFIYEHWRKPQPPLYTMIQGGIKEATDDPSLHKETR